MSQQLKITVPLPPEGSGYLKVFEEFFTAQVDPSHLVQLKEQFLHLRAEVQNNISIYQQRAGAGCTPFQVHSAFIGIRNEHHRLIRFMESSPLPPSLEEISGIVILYLYFAGEEDGDMIVSEMKNVILRRYKSTFPNADKTSSLRTEELLDSVFKSVESFYVENKVSHNYMKQMGQHFSTFIPSLIRANELGGLEIYMEVEGEPPRMTPEEARSIEVSSGYLNGINQPPHRKNQYKLTPEQYVKNLAIAKSIYSG